MHASRWTTLGAVLALTTSTGCATPGMIPQFSPRKDAAAVLEQHRAERADQKTREEEARAAQARTPVPAAELLREGDRYRESNRYADAMFTYLRAARENPTELSPKLRIGFLHLRDEPGRSVRIFEALREEAPDSPELHAGLGLAHFALGAWQPARRALQRSVELDPESAAARNALGALLDRIGEGEAARDEFRAAHRLDPENAEILGNLGTSYLMSGEFELAVEALEHATHIDPSAGALRNSLGIALGRIGRMDDAFAAFRAVGSEAQARNNLGYVYFLNGEYDLAMAEYENAIGVTAEQLPSVLQNWEAARAAAERAEEQARLDALPPPVLELAANEVEPILAESGAAAPAAGEEADAISEGASDETARSAAEVMAASKPARADAGSSRPASERSLDASLAEIDREFRALLAAQDAEASRRRAALVAQTPASEPAPVPEGEATHDLPPTDAAATELTEELATDAPATELAEEPATDAAAIELAEEPATDAAPTELTEEPATDAAAIELAEEPVTDAAATELPEEPAIDAAPTELTEAPATDTPATELAEEPGVDAPAADEAAADVTSAESAEEPAAGEPLSVDPEATSPHPPHTEDTVTAASRAEGVAPRRELVAPAGAKLVATGTVRAEPAPTASVLDAMASVLEDERTSEGEDAEPAQAEPREENEPEADPASFGGGAPAL